MSKLGFILLVLLWSKLSAQNHDYYWILGSLRDFETNQIIGSDLRFSDIDSVQTVFVPREYILGNSIATISDERGNYLFAFDMCNIYDSNHQPIPGGDQLFGHELKTLFCDTSLFLGHRGFQLSFFLPNPGKEEQYYLMHLATNIVSDEDFATHLFCSILDRNTNSLIRKNQLLIQAKFTTGMMTAVRHADGRGWWILIPEQASNAYFSMLLDENGVFHGPYKQSIGPKNLPRVWTGSAAFSPDGTHYARFDEANNLQVMSFNRCTGLLSEFKSMHVPIELSGRASLAFSSNSQYLYCAEPMNLYQIDLGKEVNLENQITHIAKIDLNPDNPAFPTGFDRMQLAPDNKIYFTNYGCQWIHIIHEPNKTGTNCSLQQHALKMKTFLRSSLPYMPNYRLGAVSCDNACCSGCSDESSFIVSPNPGYGVYTIRGVHDATMNRFRLFDLSGKIILENHFAPCLEMKIDLSNLPSSMYLLHVYGEDAFYTYKLIKI